MTIVINMYTIFEILTEFIYNFITNFKYNNIPTKYFYLFFCKLLALNM